MEWETVKPIGVGTAQRSESRKKIEGQIEKTKRPSLRGAQACGRAAGERGAVLAAEIGEKIAISPPEVG
jgi:hypothetical protein